MTTKAPIASAPLPETQWYRSYGKELALMFGVYGALIAISVALQDQTSGAVRYVVTIAPILPFATLGWIVVRLLRRVDELQRVLVYRAIAFASFGTATVTFGYGFAETAGAPHLSMFTVWPVMAALLVIGQKVAPRMP
jgi:hypothetical protein